MGQRFSGQRALVTGASRGIGAAIAQRLAAGGADVAIVARTAERHDHLPGSLAETRERLAGYGTTVATVVADLTDEDQRATIVAGAVEQLGGPIDILVNNAAAAIYQPVVGYARKRRRITYEANVFAPMDLADAVVPAMLDRGRGFIVNVSSSTASVWPGPPFTLTSPGTSTGMYGSSKAALVRWSNALGVELYGRGVRVNAVRPKVAVLTEGAQALVGETIRPDQLESVEQMVESVVALCDCAPEVTGQVFASLDLIAAWGLDVRGLDGQSLVKQPSA
ncbi:SDR family NAD(P)-dependent oxidoreductase [Mycolicibacterium sarraceniae]|uniref:Oxidoreductase n=1 Tax=Mycolicibacterium sarraceniae TaxID=1534348 RepID=A0A7I7SY91_9MYCO|nr:SDR family oxidoreductase [Mycolicibacterium sarraceniae]BBY61600.1 oxidoreductase [Mycolicibacterium sarraceniae]